MKAGSHQIIHYGAPSWRCLTEPITAQNGGYLKSSADNAWWMWVSVGVDMSSPGPWGEVVAGS
jgi:hypothetical protein